MSTALALQDTDRYRTVAGITAGDFLWLNDLETTCLVTSK